MLEEVLIIQCLPITASAWITEPAITTEPSSIGGGGGYDCNGVNDFAKLPGNAGYYVAAGGIATDRNDGSRASRSIRFVRAIYGFTQQRFDAHVIVVDGGYLPTRRHPCFDHNFRVSPAPKKIISCCR